jgi:hypothetical protein
MYMCLVTDGPSPPATASREAGRNGRCEKEKREKGRGTKTGMNG